MEDFTELDSILFCFVLPLVDTLLSPSWYHAWKWMLLSKIPLILRNWHILLFLGSLRHLFCLRTLHLFSEYFCTHLWEWFANCQIELDFQRRHFFLATNFQVLWVIFVFIIKHFCLFFKLLTSQSQSQSLSQYGIYGNQGKQIIALTLLRFLPNNQESRF